MQEGAGQKLTATAAGQDAVESYAEINAPVVGTGAGTSVAISGLDFPRYFSTAGVDPFDEVEWELRDAVIGNERARLSSSSATSRCPKAWSQQATNIVVSKYFRGQIGSPERERTRQAADRPGRRHHHRLGARARSTSRPRTRCRRSATT